MCVRVCEREEREKERIGAALKSSYEMWIGKIFLSVSLKSDFGRKFKKTIFLRRTLKNKKCCRTKFIVLLFEVFGPLKILGEYFSSQGGR